jgi:hypothetical protein
MNVEIVEELLNELGSSLERLEAQQAALLQLLKDKNIVTDDQLGTYLTQSGKASSVRWRAVRVRLDSLLSAEKQKEEQLAEKNHPQAGAEQEPVSKHAEAAKSENDSAGSEDAPHGEAAPDARALAEGTGTQSVSEKPQRQTA